ncbi:cytochrome c biogenesis protein ResB [Mesobacillus subterraneus]|uniref:Cytochrome C biogenesis protein n=1 Tax=Mesobacillus subterraneus TaxID=285983 RepID=A0A0D6ZAK1_9BACI|nr:cytochrome c biogenesis protein ResB [Mesobacillus subterraneus]KIY21618.1 cytochrome C biogenesis protein [Mesobacillus subterraneus]
MKEVKCECGHVNPQGTILCESCGRLLEDNEKEKQLIDMRYEGSARRSQTYNKTIIDKIWNFFSSVKVGVSLIIILLIASSLGTIFPQEMYIPPLLPASEYYGEKYGWLGKLYYDLGFHNLYSSWWYLILIAALGISLVIASLDRVVPLYRSLKNQRVKRHESFLKRQRMFHVSDAELPEEASAKIKAKLAKKRYKLREEDGDLLAEKNRFSRWGPYVNHLGLIIFLIGGMLRFVPGMYVDEILWLRDGETKSIPGTEGRYYLKNNQFIFEVYDKDKDEKVFKDAISKVGTVVKNYQTNATLYERQGDIIPGETPKLEKVRDQSIQVNKPLKIDGYALYQVDYKLGEMSKMAFKLENKQTKEQFGDLVVDLYDPKMSYDLGKGYKVEVMSYFPDFEFNEDGEPATKSRVPNNPAFIFNMITPDKPDGEVSFVAIRQNLEPLGENDYKMTFAGIETKNVTALTVRKDYTLWIIGLGGLIFMIGVVQGAYWNHRRLWIRRINGQIWTAAHTNKNWYGLKRELDEVFADSGIDAPKDQEAEDKKE